MQEFEDILENIYMHSLLSKFECVVRHQLLAILFCTRDGYKNLYMCATNATAWNIPI